MTFEVMAERVRSDRQVVVFKYKIMKVIQLLCFGTTIELYGTLE